MINHFPLLTGWFIFCQRSNWSRCVHNSIDSNNDLAEHLSNSNGLSSLWLFVGCVADLIEPSGNRFLAGYKWNDLCVIYYAVDFVEFYRLDYEVTT